MEDQHKSALYKFHDESIKRAEQHLKKKYPVTSIDENEEDFPNKIPSQNFTFLRISVENNNPPLTLIIAIPKNFPDEFPKIYLSKENYSKIAPIPHVDINRFVCTKDPVVAFINDNKPGEAIDKLIKVAVEIINTGIKKENQNDFIEEFLAYWNEQAEIIFLSLLIPSSKIKIVKIIQLSKETNKANHLISNSLDDAKKWLSALEINIDSSKVRDALYLPFSNPIKIPLPQNNGDIYKLMKKSGKKYSYALGEYLNRNSSNRIIIFSFPIQNDRILAGWMYQPWKKEVSRGFRKGKLPLEVRFTRSSKIPIMKIYVERIDKERLFRRGGLGIQNYIKNASISIIGCGSLGSPLAISLSKCGISKFLLMDKDTLEPANVARHVCGFSEVVNNPSKCEAVKERLIKHFPYIDCIAHKEDIFELLKKDDSILNSYDLSIIAIGDKGVERRLNYLLKKGIIKSPLIFIWMEPYAIAGHFLFTHPSKGGCFQCCLNTDGSFKYSVAKFNKDLFKRESGCQSTFIPYSNLDIDSFINIITREILFFLEKKPKNSFLLTWLGDLISFKSLGYKINEEWTASLNYTHHKKEMSKNKYCGLCGKKK